MIPLDNPEKWLQRLDACAQRYLNEEEYKQYLLISPPRREEELNALLTSPVARFTIINEVYFRARWGEVLETLCPSKQPALLEIASGDADMIPQSMSRTCPGSLYITANMNVRLNESLLKRTEGLPLNFKLIADDAAHILEHMGEAQVDIIAFQHAVNDVLQAILCGQNGIDTVYADWMETLPAMIELLKREVGANTLENSVREPFMALIKALWPTLRPGGFIAINHYLFQLDLDWGYPPELFNNMVPMAREWLRVLPGSEEIRLEGFDPHWWLFIRKD